MASLTATDELDLPNLGEKKVALFALIPDNDTSFNFLVSILYTQLFQQLFYLADHKYGGNLPVHCHFIMDEFANVSLPDDFDKILSVMRSRGVSVSIILQNLAQLKALFEKQWEIIVLACIIFSLFAAAPTAVDPNLEAVTMVWSYVGELIFNMLVLVGAVKMADRVVREMMGL